MQLTSTLHTPRRPWQPVDLQSGRMQKAVLQVAAEAAGPMAEAAGRRKAEVARSPDTPDTSVTGSLVKEN